MRGRGSAVSQSLTAVTHTSSPIGKRRLRRRRRLAVQRLEHSLDETPVDRADDGCSMAAPPNGQCSETMRSPSPCFSAWAANPWAVSASATAWNAERNERCTASPCRRPPIDRAIVRPYSTPTSSAIALASARGQQRERPPEQRHEQIVVADRRARCILCLSVTRVTLRRPPGAAAVGAVDADFDVAAARELVEVMAGDVGVQLEAFRDLAGVTPRSASWTKR